ncbi:pyridoxamine 5'-phosphate oxidase family protein [Glycomyces albidus]|uniref:Oxidoreductase n=1 Tax=Glycomyces albidus TaxID=2656774 RepID=A0A6L5GEE5_9ACTN|nr:pyridoxamine 5'-phosphate oxidase family protein [Glycomyces albidus]MQM28018.1 oxidoreductase [Glycomyces albidus]
MFHPGETSVQRRAGIHAAAHGSAAVGDEIPAVAEEFLSAQRMVVVAAERDGAMWTSALAGPPGFLQAVGASTVRIGAELPEGDPLAGAFDAAAEIGMIALEPATRRRMRINGRARAEAGGLRVDAAQVYANCPKYIQTRHAEPAPPTPLHRTEGTSLTPSQVDWVSGADTFFIGTVAPGLGADASHRGGSPGFVEADAHRITWPDYTGNSMYMTFGNLELDPRAGLLFIDWDTGHTLHVSGTAAVDWDPDRAAAHPGAHRLIDFDVERVVQLDHRLPLRWRLERRSRFNPPAKGR